MVQRSCGSMSRPRFPAPCQPARLPCSTSSRRLALRSSPNRLLPNSSFSHASEGDTSSQELDGEISQSYTQSDPETHRALGSGASFFWRSEALEVSGCVKSKPQKKVDRLKSKRLEEFLWTVSQKRGRCQKRKAHKKGGGESGR